MNRTFIPRVTTIFLLVTGSLMAQPSKEEGAVKAVIDQLFDGMHTGDSAKVHRAFTNEVTLATVATNKTNQAVLTRESSLADFLVAVGTPHKQVWSEESWGMTINVDGDFAQAWCNYAFYVDHTFSHCGVDAFHLFKSKEGWKIFHLADTRRKEPCVIPNEIKAKHK